MTHKIVHVKRRSGVQSGPDQDSLSEYGHNGSGTEGNRSVKAAQSIWRHWGCPAGIPITRPQNFELVKRRGQRKDNGRETRPLNISIKHVR